MGYLVFMTKLTVPLVWITLTFLTCWSYSAFLAASFFTTSLSLLKSLGAGTNLSTYNLSNLLFRQFKPGGTFSNLSILNS